jgi:excisionase family DNA binding protein
MHTYTIKETAELLKCSEHTIRDLIGNSKLKAINLKPESSRGCWRVTEKALRDYLGE